MSAQQWVVFDLGDETFHRGGGNWGVAASKAEKYASKAKARAVFDEIDCAEIMRNRLIIVRIK